MKIFLGGFFIVIAFVLLNNLDGSLSNQEQMIKAVISKTSKELQNKFDLHQIGWGGGINKEGKENNINLAYNHYSPLTLDEVRRVLIEGVELLLANLNGKKELIPFLEVFPFPEKYIEFSIFLLNPDGSFTYDPVLGRIALHDSEIIYRARDPNKEYGSIIVLEESYQEALEKVRKQDMIK